jgi:hypothetical protein
MFKVMFCLRRRPELSRSQFLERWAAHGRLGTSVRDDLPSIRRYIQLHTVDTPVNASLSSSRGGTAEPYDGVTEIWVDDLASLGLRTEKTEATLARLLADEAEFLDFPNCAIFLTEAHEIF